MRERGVGRGEDKSYIGTQNLLKSTAKEHDSQKQQLLALIAEKRYSWRGGSEREIRGNVVCVCVRF